MTTNVESRVRLAVDIGGTFTDVVLECHGQRYISKVLTTSRAPDDGVMQGVHDVLARSGRELADLDLILHGTTLATNAIIERKGAKTGLVTTEGFRDVLEIGYESRYDQYDIMIDKPVPLVPRHLRVTVPERIDVGGRVLLSLDETKLRNRLAQLAEHRVESIAVGFLHAYADPVHECRVRDLLVEMFPDISVSLSCEVCPEVREYERLSTTVANAYVRPLMEGYLARLEGRLRAAGASCPLLLMTSGGGLTTIETARRFPIRLVESGPAGGAILSSEVARSLNLDKVISFDMGGTTAKICLIENLKPTSAREFEVDRAARFTRGSGLPLRIPVIEMVEIGAGGGSIARLDALGQIAVGPESAGAEPGPAAYDRDGCEPTITDADILLGRIDVNGFADGKVTLRPELSARAIARAVAEPLGLETALAAYGITEMVDETMANAARVHAVEQGHDAGQHTLIAFGGAAPLHVSRLAEKLGIRRIVVPADAGVGSAVGFLRAPVSYEMVRSRNMRLDAFDPAVANHLLAGMAEEAEVVVREGAGDAELELRRGIFMRYVGQGHEVFVGLPNRELNALDARLIRDGYEQAYAQLFTRAIPGAELEVLTWSVQVVAQAPVETPAANPRAEHAATQPKPDFHSSLYDPDTTKLVDVPVFQRRQLTCGSHISGPAIVVEPQTSTFVGSKFELRVGPQGHLLIER